MQAGERHTTRSRLSPAQRRKILAHWGEASAWVAARMRELHTTEELSATQFRDRAIRHRFDRDEDDVLDPGAPPAGQRHRGWRASRAKGSDE